LGTRPGLRRDIRRLLRAVDYDRVKVVRESWTKSGHFLPVTAVACAKSRWTSLRLYLTRWLDKGSYTPRYVELSALVVPKLRRRWTSVVVEGFTGDVWSSQTRSPINSLHVAHAGQYGNVTG
jgi:hypothetical protein